MPWRDYILARLKSNGLVDEVAKRTAEAGVRPSTSASKAVVWAKFTKWLSVQELTLPIPMTAVVNFLGQLRTRAGDFISYGSFRLHKATVVNTLRLTKHLKDPSEADQQLLDHLTKTVAKESPDTARYSDMFNLDDLSAWLIEDLEESPYSSLLHSVKEHRATARRRAIITLKLHGLFRSRDCLQMQRGSLFDDLPSARLGSYWGPMVEKAGEPSFPDWVILRLTNTKTSGSVEHRVPSCPSEPALCPVLALYTYVSLAKKLVIAKYVDHVSSIWLGTTSGSDGGVKCFKPITTADPLAADTKAVMTSAGIANVYKAHALRSATASALLDAGASELDVMAHARWSSSSVFRKFYARTKQKQLSVAAILAAKHSAPSAPDPSTSAPVPVESPALPTATPRVNTVGADGRTIKVPGSNWWSPGDGSPTIKIHCSLCWDLDDSTMIWCRKCNRHYHALHFESTSLVDIEKNHLDGWFCSRCST